MSQFTSPFLGVKIFVVHLMPYFVQCIPAQTLCQQCVSSGLSGLEFCFVLTCTICHSTQGFLGVLEREREGYYLMTVIFPLLASQPKYTYYRGQKNKGTNKGFISNTPVMGTVCSFMIIQ